jgi:hypothetical protein
MSQRQRVLLEALLQIGTDLSGSSVSGKRFVVMGKRSEA